MHYETFHNDQFLDYMFKKTLAGNTVRPAAVVDCKSLDDVFEKTNNIDHAWTENPEVVRVLTPRPRSLSVGDLILDGAANKMYVVATTGFQEVTEEEHASITFDLAR